VSKRTGARKEDLIVIPAQRNPAMFEKASFTLERRIGLRKTVAPKTIAAVE